MARMNNHTKLTFALEHIAHLEDLFENNADGALLGASLRDIMNAGQTLVFTLEPVRGTSFKEPQFDNVPLLMFWNRNHFVVYEGQKNNKYVINDPAEGRRFIDESQFSKSFSGIMLKITETPKDINFFKQLVISWSNYF